MAAGPAAETFLRLIDPTSMRMAGARSRILCVRSLADLLKGDDGVSLKGRDLGAEAMRPRLRCRRSPAEVRSPAASRASELSDRRRGCGITAQVQSRVAADLSGGHPPLWQTGHCISKINRSEGRVCGFHIVKVVFQLLDRLLDVGPVGIAYLRPASDTEALRWRGVNGICSIVSMPTNSVARPRPDKLISCEARSCLRKRSSIGYDRQPSDSHVLR